MNIELKTILTKPEILKQVDEIVRKGKTTYIDAIVTLCERLNLDIETVGSIIKGNEKMTANIQEEAENLNLLEKQSRLPF